MTNTSHFLIPVQILGDNYLGFVVLSGNILQDWGSLKLYHLELMSSYWLMNVPLPHILRYMLYMLY